MDKKSEALRLADIVGGHCADVLRAQHARIAELEEELVKESAHTADYKLIAEQFEQRLDMANKLGNDARQELAKLKGMYKE